MRRTTAVLVSASLAALVAPVTAAPTFKVIAHPAVAVSELTRTDLSRMFLKKQAAWRDGTHVVPVDLPVSSAVRAAFSTAVHAKGVGAIDAYWQKMIFTGRDLPPVTKASDAEILAFVRTNKGAIGYVSGDAALDGVRVITVK